MEISTATKSMSLAKNIYEKSCNIYAKIKTDRIKSFAKTIELRYEYMSKKDLYELNKFIGSEEGESILIDFIDAVVSIKNKTVMTALALLYCKDSDFDLSLSEQMIFLRASKDLDENIVRFYLKAYRQQSLVDELMAYDRKVISKDDLEEYKGIASEGMISFYINLLISLGLLLPDPRVHAVFGGVDDVWEVPYGTNSTTDKFSALLNKSGTLAEL